MMPSFSESLVCLGSLNAKREDRSIGRTELQSVQVVLEGRPSPVEAVSRIGELGISSLAVIGATTYLTDGAHLYSWTSLSEPPELIPVAGLEDVHEMQAIDGKLWMANTSRNELVCFDPATRSACWRLRLPEARAAKGASESHYHVNQCFEGPDGEMLALVHHVAGRRSGLKARVAEALTSQATGGVICPRTGEVKLTGLKAPHSARRLPDGSWIVCDSGRFELRRYDPRWGLLQRVGTGGWSRGVAIGRDHVYVGISQMRRRYQSLLAKTARSSNCILVLEPEELRIVDEICIPNVEQINNLYVMDPELSWIVARPRPHEATEASQGLPIVSPL